MIEAAQRVAPAGTRNSMIIGHFSDLHGHLNWLDPVLQARGLPDVFVCSGDFFPNQTRGIVGAEVRYQTRWFG